MAAELEGAKEQDAVSADELICALGRESLERCANCPDAQGLLANANTCIATQQAVIKAIEADADRYRTRFRSGDGSSEAYQTWVLGIMADSVEARQRTITLIRNGMAAVPVTCRGPLMTTMIKTTRAGARLKMGEKFTCRHPEMTDANGSA